jgi:hypothetical protein
MRHKLQPPSHLSKTEAALFSEILLAAPPNQFSLSDAYLLSSFCQVTILIRAQARMAAKAKKENRQAEIKLVLEGMKTQSLLATKLRLTTLGRTAAHTVARSHDKHRPPSAYDEMRQKGWID